MQLLPLVIVTVAAAAPSGDEIRRAADKVLSRSDLQTELPSGDFGLPRGAGDGSESITQPRNADSTFRPRPGSGGVAGSLFAGILWALLIAVGLLIVAWLVHYLVVSRRDGGEVDPVDAAEAAPVDLEVVTAPRADAEALAAQGRFAEAIHTLLLQTLQRLIETTNTSIPASLTSREILARVPLPPPAFAALGDLVGAVEVTHFGPAIPGPDDYAHCRARFDVFADAYVGGRR